MHRDCYPLRSAESFISSPICSVIAIVTLTDKKKQIRTLDFLRTKHRIPSFLWDWNVCYCLQLICRQHFHFQINLSSFSFFLLVASPVPNLFCICDSISLIIPMRGWLYGDSINSSFLSSLIILIGKGRCYSLTFSSISLILTSSFFLLSCFANSSTFFNFRFWSSHANLFSSNSFNLLASSSCYYRCSWFCLSLACSDSLKRGLEIY